MIAGEVFGRQLLETVLALVVIPQEDVVTRHGDPDTLSVHKVCQPNDGWHLQSPRNRPQDPIVALDDLDLAHTEHRDSPLPGNHPKGLICGVQKKSPIHDTS